MRLGLAAALTAITLFALLGCSQPQSTTGATSQPVTPAKTIAAPLSTPTTEPISLPTPTLKPTLVPFLRPRLPYPRLPFLPPHRSRNPLKH